MFCHVAKSHNNKLSIKKLFFPFQVHVSLVCLANRDRSHNCDSLLEVYRYLIGCLLGPPLALPFKWESRPRRAGQVDLVSSKEAQCVFSFDYVSVSTLLNSFSPFALNALWRLYIMYRLISSIPHYTARWALEFCRAPLLLNYIFERETMQLLTCQVLLLTESSPSWNLVSNKRLRSPYDWFVCLRCICGFSLRKGNIALGSDLKRAFPRCSQLLHFSLWKRAFTQWKKHYQCICSCSTKENLICS